MVKTGFERRISRISFWTCVLTICNGKLPYIIFVTTCRFQVECYAIEALCSLGRFEEALRLLDLQLLVKDDVDMDNISMPHSVRSDLNRAIVCCYQGKYSDAYVNLVRLREKYPYLAPINRSFLFVLLRLGLHKDALFLVRSCHNV